MAIANYSSRIAAVCYVFLVLTWTCVSMRCYTRIFIVKSFGLDDYLAVLSLFLFSSFCALFLVDSHYGLGQHTINIPSHNLPNVMKYWLIAAMTWCWTTMAYKASICVFLARIVVEPVQLTIIWTVLAVNTFGCLALFLIFLLGCSPIDYFWTQYIPPAHHGHCLSQELVANLALGQASIMLIVDITIVVLPIYMVWNLQMTPRTKIGVAFILSLGAVASIATIIRFPYIAVIHKHALDFPYVTVNHTIWSLLEPAIGIMAAAMATLRPLFRAFLSHSTLWSGGKLSTARSKPDVQHVVAVAKHQGFRRWGGITEDLQEEGDMEEVGLKGSRDYLNQTEVGLLANVEHMRRKPDRREPMKQHVGGTYVFGEETVDSNSGKYLQDVELAKRLQRG